MFWCVRGLRPFLRLFCLCICDLYIKGRFLSDSYYCSNSNVFCIMCIIESIDDQFSLTFFYILLRICRISILYIFFFIKINSKFIFMHFLLFIYDTYSYIFTLFVFYVLFFWKMTSACAKLIRCLRYKNSYRSFL